MSEFVIQTNNLTKIYDNTVVRDLSLNIPKGSLYALIGRNGAGKTTTLKMILGILLPSLGSSSILGENSSKLSVDIKQRVTFVDEKQSMYGWMKIKNIISLTASLYHNWDYQTQDNLLKSFELDPSQKVQNLSLGEKTKLSLLLATCPHPDILILDDISAQLDTVTRKQFISSIIEMIQKEGRTILFSSHLLTEVEKLADHIAIIDKGILKVNTSADALKESYKRVQMIFDQNIPEIPPCTGEVSRKSEGRSVTMIMECFSRESIENLKKYNPIDIIVDFMTLEDIFIAITT